MSRFGALPALAVASVVIGLVVGGCAAPGPVTEPEPTAPPSSTPGSTPGSPPSPAIEVPLQDAGITDPAQVIAPSRVTMPALDIDMSVQAEGIDADGAMDLPADAAIAGWYQFGPGVAAESGATVIAAHVDSYHDGIGPFSRLKDAAIGSTVMVAGDDGSTVEYAVTEVRSVGKIDAPMAELFDRTGAPRLTLVTCGGVFDSSTGHYLDNIVLTATPVATGR